MEPREDLYRGLDKQTKQIRVLVMHAASSSDVDSAITCSLETVNLAMAHPFYALSYVWGPPAPTMPISVEDQTLYIRKNLWQFLHAIRSRFCHRANDTIRLWTDYICIHQGDMQELSDQVSIMGDIYQTADAVYAWLGNNAEQGDDDMKHIETIRQMRHQNRTWIQIFKECKPSFQHIASSPYWTRLWIKQEVILGKDLWFFYGSDIAHWKDMRFAVGSKPEHLRRVPTRHASRNTDEQQSDLSPMTSLLSLRALHSGDASLAELVTRFRQARCHDAKDRIYAMLALTHPDVRAQITVDYDKPFLQVLLENYHHWTGEREAWSSVNEAGARVAIYQFGSFCSQFAQLLPIGDLGLLYNSETLRKAITARGVFAMSGLSQITFVSVLAAMDDSKIQPIAAVDELSSSNSGLVLRIVVGAQNPRHSRLTRDHFVYAMTMPESGDLFGRIGSRMFFFRAREAQKLRLVGNGSEAQTTSLHDSDLRLSTRLLQHPRLWLRRQLPDASFQAIERRPKPAEWARSARRELNDIAIECNGAATVALLSESKSFAATGLDEGRIDQLPGTDVECKNPDVNDAAQASDLWSPYAFGLQHKLLDSCRTCRVWGTSSFNLQRQWPTESVREECECKWRLQPSERTA
ncbi:hypothetical protein LTR74_013389 [Friedmanniomyces endolithicus]|nr:hypothetical protein LTR74_013389 [Friedmanniomyces endolithicus]